MRATLALVCLIAAACASTSSTMGTSGSTVDRRTTGVTYTGPQGSIVNLELESRSVLETRSTPISATPRELWVALALAYQDLGIPLAAHDSVQMVMGNPGYSVVQGRVGNRRVSAYLNCGADPLGASLADRYAVRLNAVSRVRVAQGSTLLETQVVGDASQRGTAGNPVPCASTGLLEETLANAVKLRLAGSHPAGPHD